jgi:anaerobic selenocysteine-containing dehydrogenase
MEEPNMPSEKHECTSKLSRRKFMQISALLGGTLALPGWFLQSNPEQVWADDTGDAYLHYKPENQLYSVCQQCNTNCGIKVKMVDGRVAKIDGNPYNPWTMTPQIPYDTPIAQAALTEGSICPKGQAGIQTLYDPYRVVKVLKRAGKRGENKWKTIPFDDAVKEIVEGGDLFGEGPVEGLRDICVLDDKALADDLSKDAAAVASQKMTVDDFKIKHADNLHYLIDSDHPDLGPKNNQFCFNWGRLKAGRSEFIRRLVNDALGSVNAHGHTTVCQGSLYFTCKAMSDQFVEGKFTGGSKFYWQGDTGNAEFILFVGSNPYEANYGPPLRAQKVTHGLVEGRLKIAVMDPRCSKTASRAWKWLPINPLGVGAAAMAVLNWMIVNQRYDAQYLANANRAAAAADGEPTWTQASWLVKLDDQGAPGELLRGSHLGLTPEKRPKQKEEGDWDFDPFVVIANGVPVVFDPNDDKNTVEGDLLVDHVINDHKVKSVLRIIEETVTEKSLAEWCELAGIPEADLIEVARELTSHGKKAVVDIHRGVSQHTGGFYNVLSWMTVNVLLGNHDWMGGLAKATTFDHAGSREGKPFDLSKGPGKIKRWGVDIIRGGARYDKSTLFQGYPAKRTWYPFCSDIYQETIPSMGDMYPYQIKALFLYMAAPVYSLPSGHTLVDVLLDPKKIPLVFASDIVIGETSMYADYIFPDLTYLERWEFSGSHPSVTPKVAPLRQPLASPMTDTVKVFGQDMPLSVESLVLALAEKTGVPHYGENAFGPGLHLKRDEDMYLRMAANIAFGDKPDGSEMVPAADQEEMRIFAESRKHLPATVFDPKRWQAVVGDKLWPHVVYVLNRGGRFQAYDQAYKNNQLANKYGNMVGIYFDNLVKAKHSQTGLPYLPHPAYVDGPRDCNGQLIDDAKQGFDLTLITYKTITQTKSRTGGNYWLQAVYPENFMEISRADAERLGLADGDRVRVVSATNLEGSWKLGPELEIPMIGRVLVREGLRPGVTAFSLGHGHWAQGAGQVIIDGQVVPPDPRRQTGIHANAAMRVDPFLKNTTLSDTVGGSAVFYQSQVKLVKV